MGYAHARAGQLDSAHDPATDRDPLSRGDLPGKRTLVERDYGHGEAGADPRHATAEQPAPRGHRGAPLGGGVRSWMERAFGTDFSAVRVHEGPEAASVGAIAFARGEDLFFAPGAYRPETSEGREVLAHELTHVVQQRAGGQACQAKGAAVNGDASLEAEADQLGARAAAGHAVTVRGVASAASGVQRVTHYPTKEGGAPQGWAIPTGTGTQNMATQILQQLGLAGATALKHKKGGDGKRDDSTPRTEGYMVGVVLLDDGTYYAACSGDEPPGFAAAVRAAGATPISVQVNKEEATQIVKRGKRSTDPQDPNTGGVTSAKHPANADEWTEVGAPAGACAASKLIWALADSLDKKPTQMAERLFAPNGPPYVAIAEEDQSKHSYHDGDLVPSCLTCQAFLSQILPELNQRIDAHRVKLQKEQEEKRKLMEAVARSEQLQAADRERTQQLREQEARLAQEEARAQLLAQIEEGLRKLLVTDSKLKSNKANDPKIEAAKAILKDFQYPLSEVVERPDKSDLKKLETIKNRMVSHYEQNKESYM